MKKNTFLILLASLFFCANIANAHVNATGAEDFVKNMTNEGIEDIINANVSKAEKQVRFKKLFNEALDLDFIGKYVLGRYWRTATPTQRADFIKVYRDLNIKTWSKRFNEFKGKNFVFKGTAPSTSKGQVFVDTEVPMDQGAPAKVLWRVKEKGNDYKIVDIVIEGVSLAQASRSEYTSFIKNNPGGLDALIKDLSDRLNKL